MISLYRWQPGQKHGTWQDRPELPADGLVPDGEVWWIDLADPTPEEEVAVFKTFLPIHPLSLEDIERPRKEADAAPHFPKVEEFPDYLFVIANPLRPPVAATAPETGTRATVQLSAVLTHRALVTHHYESLVPVTSVKQFLGRHAEQAGRGPDYVYHLVLDAMVDEYAPEIDRLVERLDEIETQIFLAHSEKLLTDLLHLKRRVVTLRKTLILEREVLARLVRGEFDLVDDREIAYYRNVYDHLVRYTELIEGAREMVSDLMQTHLAIVSNRLNGVMKVLATISTIILPMTLVAGIYGMNFDVIPELHWQYGYPFALGLMVLSAVGCLSIFYWKKLF